MAVDLLLGTLLAASPGVAGPLHASLLAGRVSSEDAFVLACLPVAGKQPCAASTKSPEPRIEPVPSRFISREEVVRAINESSRAPGEPPAAPVRAEQLQMNTSLRTTRDPQLAITEAVYDPLLKCKRYRLMSRSNSKSPPFYVWVLSSQNSPSGGSASLHNSSYFHGQALGLDAHPGVVIVDPSRLASLYLHSQNMTTVAVVRPLQPGQAGEIVRVRLPNSGKTLRARVVGTDLLEAAF